MPQHFPRFPLPHGWRVRAHPLQSQRGMNLTTSRDHALRVAVWAVIASEAVMFAALLALRGGPRLAPSTGTMVLAIAITTALFAGGAALASALRRTRDGQSAAAARLLVLVSGFGFVALALELVGARFVAVDPLSTVIIGLHAAHVSAGIALATWILALVRIGRVHRRHHHVLQLVATYWYFIATVWVFVWPLLTSRP